MHLRTAASRLVVFLISLSLSALGSVSASADPDGSETDSAAVDLLDATPVPMIIDTDGGAPVVSKDDYLNGHGGQGSWQLDLG